MKKNGITVLIRGLRNTIDFEYEKNLYYLYKDMMPEIEVCYVFTDRDKFFVSSSNVREILSLNGDPSAYVSSEAISLINNLYGAK
jgi:pantetheine-phosphate adenylyltransferase